MSGQFLFSALLPAGRRAPRPDRPVASSAKQKASKERDTRSSPPGRRSKNKYRTIAALSRNGSGPEKSALRPAQGRERLADVACIALDNRVPPGDAGVTLTENLRAGPPSTLTGAAPSSSRRRRDPSRREGSRPFTSARTRPALPSTTALVSRFRARNRHL